MQANHPWELENTLFPISIFTFFMLMKNLFVRRPRINIYYLKRGLIILCMAVYFFFKGLDDMNDYMRINHGLWHCCVGLSSFYLWQSIDKDKPDPDIKSMKLSKQPRFIFYIVVKKLLKFDFFSPQNYKLPHYS